MRGAFLSGQDWSHAARKIERMEKLTKEDEVNEIKPVFIQPDLDYQIVDSYPRAKLYHSKNPVNDLFGDEVYDEAKRPVIDLYNEYFGGGMSGWYFEN